MSKIIDMNGKPVTYNPENDTIAITRKDWGILVENSKTYKDLFDAAKIRLDALEKDVRQLKGRPRSWWRS